MVAQGHRKLCKRYDIPWQAHALTFSCFRRQPFFSGQFAPGWFLESLDAARTAEPFDLWGFVIMPEHVHLLVLPGDSSRIARILWRIKKPLTDRVLEWVAVRSPEFLPRMEHRREDGRVVHRFWQPGGGFDRNLWNARLIHKELSYMHENPVRRGLVAKAADWPWSSARAWAEGVDVPLRIDRESMPIRVL
ncbi:MAG TPA: hypothetical protein VM098_05900 [Phycisphaerae bacterium]|nr:hypothetical protein [Phycisphaerae bacterium]